MHHGQLRRRGSQIDSAAPTVVTNPSAAIVWHLIVVNVVNDRNIHICYGAVVVNCIVPPISAVITAARVSIAVVDAAIKTNTRCPEAPVPSVDVILIAPPRRRPQRTHIRSQHPRAGHPVITGAGIAPSTGRPNVILAGSGRLGVLGERRRRLRGLNRLLVGGELIVIRGEVVRIARGGRGLRWLVGLIVRRQISAGGICAGGWHRLIGRRRRLTGWRRCLISWGRSLIGRRGLITRGRGLIRSRRLIGGSRGLILGTITSSQA
jgi:hypothetical protein